MLDDCYGCARGVVRGCVRGVDMYINNERNAKFSFGSSIWLMGCCAPKTSSMGRVIRVI